MEKFIVEDVYNFVEIVGFGIVMIAIVRAI
jgi:hypothetical protein